MKVRALISVTTVLALAGVAQAAQPPRGGNMIFSGGVLGRAQITPGGVIPEPARWKRTCSGLGWIWRGERPAPAGLALPQGYNWRDVIGSGATFVEVLAGPEQDPILFPTQNLYRLTRAPGGAVSVEKVVATPIEDTAAAAPDLFSAPYIIRQTTSREEFVEDSFRFAMTVQGFHFIQRQTGKVIAEVKARASIRPVGLDPDKPWRQDFNGSCERNPWNEPFFTTIRSG